MLISREAYQVIQSTLDGVVLDAKLAACGRTLSAMVRKLGSIESTLSILKKAVFNLEHGVSSFPGVPTMYADQVGLQLIRARVEGLILDCQAAVYSSTKDSAARQALVIGTRANDLKLVVDQNIYPDGPNAA